MRRVLICISDAQLYLLLRHVLATEGFEADLATHPSDVAVVCRNSDVRAAILDWTGDVADTKAALNAVTISAPNASLICLARHESVPDECREACSLVLERPFDPSALLRFLRRLRYDDILDKSDVRGSILQFADLSMNLATMKVQRGGHDVKLTALEFRLLHRLLEKSLAVCDRDDLIEACWPAGAEVEPRTVDIHIGHLRRALKQYGPDLIRTVRGSGYALDMPKKANGRL